MEVLIRIPVLSSPAGILTGLQQKQCFSNIATSPTAYVASPHVAQCTGWWASVLTCTKRATWLTQPVTYACASLSRHGWYSVLSDKVTLPDLMNSQTLLCTPRNQAFRPATPLCCNKHTRRCLGAGMMFWVLWRRAVNFRRDQNKT